MVYVVKIAFLDIIVMKQSKNGANLSALSRQLIGAKFRLIHRYLLEIMKKKNGVIDTLQNTEAEEYFHLAMEPLLGQRKTTKIVPGGNMQN